MAMTEAQQEAWAERAGIMEFDAGMSRQLAERCATVCVMNPGRDVTSTIARMVAMEQMREALK